MPTGFHPNPHFFSAHLELAVELLRFLAVPQFPLVPFTPVRIDKRNLLEARVIVTTYNDHVRLLSPEPWLASATKVYSGMGADIVMESLHSRPGSERNRLCLLKKSLSRNPQKLDRVRMPYKRFSLVAWTFSIPQICPDF